MTFTLQDIAAFIEARINLAELEASAQTMLDGDGLTAANAVVTKLASQTPAGWPTEKALADATFREFEHLLRFGAGDMTGNALTYPGAPSWLPALGAGADLLYTDGPVRSTIREWCNAAAASWFSSSQAAVIPPTPATPSMPSTPTAAPAA